MRAVQSANSSIGSVVSLLTEISYLCTRYAVCRCCVASTSGGIFHLFAPRCDEPGRGDGRAGAGASGPIEDLDGLGGEGSRRPTRLRGEACHADIGH